MELHKTVLAKATIRLLHDLDPITLLDYLTEDQVLSYIVVRDIQDLTTTSEKTRKIIDQFKTKDQNSYNILKQCLIESNQKHLADYLTRLEVDVKQKQVPSYTSIHLPTSKPALPQAMEDLQFSDKRVPTENELKDIAECIGRGWEFLAIQLGLPNVEVQRIKENDKNDMLMQIYNMLMKWTSLQPNATLQSLFAAMNKVRKSVSIDYFALKNKFGSDIFDEKPKTFSAPASCPLPFSIIRQQIELEPKEEKSGTSDSYNSKPNMSVAVWPNSYSIDSHSTEGSNLGSQNIGHEEAIGQLGHTVPRNSNMDDADLPQKMNDMHLVTTNETRNAGSQQDVNMDLDTTDAKHISRPEMGMQQPVEFPQNVNGTDLAVNNQERRIDLPQLDNFHLIPSNAEMTKSTYGHQEPMQQNEANAESSSIIDTMQESLNKLKHITNKNTSAKRVPPRDSNANNEPVFNSEDQVRYQKCVHDGRLIHLKPAQLETVINVIKNDPDKEIGEGGFGKVHLIKSGVLLDIQMVLKTIECGPNDAEKVKSVTNEKLSARIMHFAVVPLIAFAENRLDKNGKRMIHHHFMSPYLPGGSLLKKIKEDNKNKDKICLYQGDRIRILYHIASAIDYLHTPVNSLRNEVHHRDITSNNIVIDGNGNARLIDFGLAYEIKEGTRPANSTKLSCRTAGYTEDDNKNFGIVIRELLTGQEAMENEKELAKFTSDDIRRFMCRRLPHIWCNEKKECNSEATTLNELSQALCQGKEVKDLSESLWHLLNNNGLPMWKRNGDTKKCEVCMVNPTAPDTLQEGRCNSEHIKVCIACLRNSYLNPVKCHSCQNTLTPVIGYQWGALLIAGCASGSNKEEAKAFYGDVQALKKILVSKSPLIMGLNDDNVVTVVPDDKASMKDKLSIAFSSFKTKAVKKLIIFYSGHHCDGFLLDKRDVYSKDDLENEIMTLSESGIEKFLIIFDCCYAPGMVTPLVIQNETISICQLNACEPRQISSSDFDGGIFSKLLCQALRGESVKPECFVTQNQQGIQEACDICKKFQMQSKPNGYITVENLLKYSQDHFNIYVQKNCVSKAQEPMANYCKVAWKDAVIAYYIDLKMEFKFLLKYGDKQVSHSVLPCEFHENFEQLQVLLFEKFKELMNLPNLDTTDFKDIIRIIMYEKKCRPTNEINTSEKLISAWNARMDSLIVTLRDVENITRGKVGLFLPEEHLNTILQIFKVPDQVFTQPNNGYSHIRQVEIDVLSGMRDQLESLEDTADSLFQIITTAEQEGSGLYSHLEILFPNKLCDDTSRPRENFVCFKLCKK